METLSLVAKAIYSPHLSQRSIVRIYYTFKNEASVFFKIVSLASTFASTYVLFQLVFSCMLYISKSLGFTCHRQRHCVIPGAPFTAAPIEAGYTSKTDRTSFGRPICFGRGRRLRTLGLRFWRPPLYQLSYSPVFHLVDRQGLEPRTDRL